MEKASYYCQNPAILWKVVEAKHLNKTKRRIQEHGGFVSDSKVGGGYTPPQPVSISGQ